MNESKPFKFRLYMYPLHYYIELTAISSCTKRLKPFLYLHQMTGIFYRAAMSVFDDMIGRMESWWAL